MAIVPFDTYSHPSASHYFVDEETNAERVLRCLSRSFCWDAGVLGLRPGVSDSPIIPCAAHRFSWPIAHL